MEVLLHALMIIVVGMRCFFTYGSFAWVGGVAVVPEYQHKKIGTKIMMRILEELKNRNIRTIRLDSTRAGYKLDKKLGFIEEYHCIRMRLGPTCNEDTSRIYGIPNYAKG